MGLMIASMTAGDLVAAWRELVKMTQEEFAERLGMARSRLGDIEADRASPTVRTLLRVIAAIEPHYESLGESEDQKLARFFQGPSAERAIDRFESAARSVLGIRKRGRKR